MNSKRTISGSIPRSLLNLARLFSRDKKGVTTIEFAVLALPFFALIAAILETSLVFMASNIFESALHDTARLIRTGQAHEEDYDIEKFRASMCSRTFGMFDCSAIKINVREVASFSVANIVDPIDPDTNEWTLTEGFNAGQRRTIMVAEAYYKWDTMFNIMGFNLATMSDNTLLMGSAQVFRNEPF
jgi:Flp pilus assembly protein TadG